MAVKKKTEKTEDTVVTENAVDTLHPNSQPVNDPKSRIEMITSMIGSMHAKTTDELTQLFNAVLGQIGHEADSIPSGTAEQNKSTIEAKPSAAVKEAVKLDVSDLLGTTEDLSEEFKERATTLFEAAVEARVILEREKIQEEIEAKFNEEYENTFNSIVESLDTCLDYAAKTWLTENEVAITSTLRSEITEEFISKLHDLFLESNINIPEEQVNVVEALTDKIDELETHVNNLLGENVKLVENIETLTRAKIVEEKARALPLLSQPKFKELCENIEFETADQFSKKLDVIKESHFKAQLTPTKEVEELNEDDSLTNKNQPTGNPEMRAFVAAIKRTAGKK